VKIYEFSEQFRLPHNPLTFFFIVVVGGAPNRVPAPLAAERVALFALEAVNFVRKFRTKDGNQVR